MPGGILQLIAKGIDDAYLINDPQITLFKCVYRRHANFSQFPKILNFNRNLTFENISRCKIPKDADLVTKLNLQITLPPINMKYKSLTNMQVHLILKPYGIYWYKNDQIVFTQEDYDEVKVYFTNPIKNDTDGDGYMDGIEVQNGYDPNGPGKLGTEERSATEWKEYIDDRYNFKIKYPKGWYYAKYSEGTTVVSFDEAASLADLSKESAKHKLHIVAEENSENLNIKEWIESYYGDISYLNIKYVTIGGYDAVQIDGAPTMYNEVIETHIVKNGKVFIFRMIGNGVNDPKISPQNREYYNEIISSIKFN